MPCAINTTHLLMVVIFSLTDCDLLIDTGHRIMAKLAMGIHNGDTLMTNTNISDYQLHNGHIKP